MQTGKDPAALSSWGEGKRPGSFPLDEILQLWKNGCSILLFWEGEPVFPFRRREMVIKAEEGGKLFLNRQSPGPVPEVRRKGFLRICPVLSLPNSGTEGKIAEKGAALFFRGIRPFMKK